MYIIPFGKPGAIPTIRHNPLDLRHAPHASHEGIDPNAIGIEPDDATGEEDGEYELSLWAGRVTRVDPETNAPVVPPRPVTLHDFIYFWAPPSDSNDTAHYLEVICDGLAMPPDAPLSSALDIQA